MKAPLNKIYFFPKYMRYICTCNEDLCNDDCNSCRQLCDMQDGPLKVVEEEDEVVPEVKSKETHLSQH